MYGSKGDRVMTIDRIKEIILRERNKVMYCNRDLYDLVCNSYVREMQKRKEDLTSVLSLRIRTMQSRDVSMIPPLLCQRRGETNNDYITRCYYAGDYKS